MASGSRFILPNQFTVDELGPRAGAKLYFYATGTNAPQNTYADPTLITPNTNPVVADSLGQFGNVWLLLSPAYRVTLTDADDVEVWTMDPVSPEINVSGAPQTGAVVATAGPTVWSGWLLCDGSAVSRTTYATLFAEIGTAWGTGDGSTTFNVPDLRGRALFGKDNMGGSAANRLTAGVSGITGTTLGATGGDQRLYQHTHSITDPQHTHAVTDPGHDHDTTAETSASGGGSLIKVFDGGSGPTQDFSTSKDVTGLTVDSAATGITISNAGAGTAQNVPPAGVINWLIFAG